MLLLFNYLIIDEKYDFWLNKEIIKNPVIQLININNLRYNVNGPASIFKQHVVSNYPNDISPKKKKNNVIINR